MLFKSVSGGMFKASQRDLLDSSKPERVARKPVMDVTSSVCFVKFDHIPKLHDDRHNAPTTSTKYMPAPSFYQNRVLEQYAAQETKRVTLRQLTVFGRTLTEDKLIKSANYVRAELPVRLAHRIFDFQHLPFIVGTNPHIEHIYQLYWEAFELFRSIPPITNLEENREFCDTVEHMLDAHLVAIPRLAMGITEAAMHVAPKEADRFMNDMLRSRIGRRVLAEQHIMLSAVFDGREHQEDGYIGIVNTRCRALDVVKKCIGLASEVMHEAFGVQVPEVIIDGHTEATFTYIPDQIEYIIFELLKNSILPPIRATIASAPNLLTFRISDRGGGIPSSILQHIWSYSHPSKRKFLNFVHVPRLAAKIEESELEHRMRPMGMRLGLGLPMSKVYANYWGGDVEAVSMEEFGTDVYVVLRVGNQVENLTYASG
ncbi:putative pyruvate dehydrogenase kinase [Gaertneriomyces semiglobifer]|nr:putative pyruvate dehydrogenase kinase [Gaertneriomyces semiglobifer]